MSNSAHHDDAPVPVAVDRAGVLRALRGDREAQHAAEVAVLRTTVDWAMLHALWDWDQAEHLRGRDGAVGGSGCSSDQC